MRAQMAMSWLVLGLITSGAASATTSSLQAVLASPAFRKTVVLDGRVWRCTGQVCIAGGEGRNQSLARECARVARKLGRLTAYSRDGKSVDEATLQVCNRT